MPSLNAHKNEANSHKGEERGREGIEKSYFWKYIFITRMPERCISNISLETCEERYISAYVK